MPFRKAKNKGHREAPRADEATSW